MKTLAWGNAIFLAALAVHLLVWKVRVPSRQAKALGLILLAVAVSGLACLAFVPGLPLRPSGAPELAQVALYVCAFSLAYLITYSAIEVDSPSLLLSALLRAAGPAGLGREELLARLDDRRLVEPRIDDLLKDRMAFEEGGRYRLTPKGAALAALFSASRKFLNLGKGG